MTTHELLVGARNRINRGWAQGNPGARGDDGKYCALGALGAELGLDLYGCGCLRISEINRSEAGEILHRLNGGGQLYKWNDARGRTKEEVLALFDRAIAETAPQPDLTFLAEVRDRVSA